MHRLDKHGTLIYPIARPTMAIDSSTNPQSQSVDISLPARLEAILYLKGKPLSIKEMSELTQETNESIDQALLELMAAYAQRDTALAIQEQNGLYSLQLRKGLGELVQNLLPVDISLGALRTLAAIALKKRILQSDLVDLRGSGAYDHIKELVSQNFIERRRQSDGRSYWITLTEKFHRTFSVLPDISSNEPVKAA